MKNKVERLLNGWRVSSRHGNDLAGRIKTVVWSQRNCSDGNTIRRGRCCCYLTIQKQVWNVRKGEKIIQGDEEGNSVVLFEKDAAFLGIGKAHVPLSAATRSFKNGGRPPHVQPHGLTGGKGFCLRRSRWVMLRHGRATNAVNVLRAGRGLFFFPREKSTRKRCVWSPLWRYGHDRIPEGCNVCANQGISTGISLYGTLQAEEHWISGLL